MAKTGSLRPLFRSATGKMLLTLKTEREIALLLRRANAQEADPALRLVFDDVIAERRVAQHQGYAMSLGTSVPGAAALAILLPVPRGTEPMTLSVGGPMKEVKREKARLLALLNDSVAQLRRAAAG